MTASSSNITYSSTSRTIDWSALDNVASVGSYTLTLTATFENFSLNTRTFSDIILNIEQCSGPSIVITPSSPISIS